MLVSILFYSSISVLLIILTVYLYRRPIKTDALLSLVWRGAVGGLTGGYFGSLFLLFLNRDQRYFLLLLVYLIPFTPFAGTAITASIWAIQSRARMPFGIIIRAIAGAAMGALIGWIAGAFYPVVHSILVTLGITTGLVAGIMAGPRNYIEPKVAS